MDISELPFNKLIGLEIAGPENSLMVAMPAGDRYLNHLGTVHASALLAVAEAGSGEFLYRNFGHISHAVPVLRKLEARFRRPASGRVASRCVVSQEVVAEWGVELASRKRLLAAIPVEVIDSAGSVVLTATAEWFIAVESHQAQQEQGQRPDK